MLCPRPGRVDHNRRCQNHLCLVLTPVTLPARRVDGGHFAILNQSCAVPFGGFDERVGGEGCIGVA